MINRLPRAPAGVLMDFDGVIVDSVRLKAQAFLDVYADEPVPALERVLAYVSGHGGVTRSVKFAHLERHVFGRSADAASIERLCALYAQRVHEAVVGCPLVGGAERFVRHASRMTELHLISGTPHDELVDIVTRRGLAGCFTSIHGAPATKRAAFAAILAGYGHASQRLVAVGDALTEYEAATALGIAFVGVLACGDLSPFPAGVPVVHSLERLDQVLGLA